MLADDAVFAANSIQYSGDRLATSRGFGRVCRPGGRIVVGLLPHRLSWKFARLEPYGLFILLALLFTGILGIILWPLIGLFIGLVAMLTGLDPAQLVGLIRIVLS